MFINGLNNFHPIDAIRHEIERDEQRIRSGFNYAKGKIENEIEYIKRTPKQVADEIKAVENKIASGVRSGIKKVEYAEGVIADDLKWVGQGIVSGAKTVGSKTEHVAETLYDDFKSGVKVLNSEIDDDVKRATYAGAVSLPFIAIAIPIGLVLAFKFL